VGENELLVELLLCCSEVCWSIGKDELCQPRTLSPGERVFKPARTLRM
jgi:hypothetical protein